MVEAFIWVVSELILIIAFSIFVMKDKSNKKEYLMKYIKIFIGLNLIWFLWVFILKWNINLIMVMIILCLLLVILTEKKFHFILKVIGSSLLIFALIIFNCISFSTKMTLLLDNIFSNDKIEYIEEYQYKDKRIVISKNITDKPYWSHFYSIHVYDDALHIFVYKNITYSEYIYQTYRSDRNKLVMKIYKLNENNYLFYNEEITSEYQIIINNEEINGLNQFSDERYIYFIYHEIPEVITADGEDLKLDHSLLD